MEDKQLTPDQSLELIRDMVRQTRKNMTFRQGNLFLLWGYLLTACAVAVFILLHTTGCRAWQWLWVAPIIIGMAVTWWQRKHHAPHVSSYSDKLLQQIWSCILVVSLFTVFESANGRFVISVIPIVLIVVGTGLFITGQTMNNKFMYYSSIFVLIFGLKQLSGNSLFSFPDGELIAFAIATAIGLIGSGYALNRQVKRDARKISEKE